MFEVTTPHPNTICVEIAGLITPTAMAAGLSDLLAAAQSVNRGHLVYKVHGMPTPLAPAVLVQMAYMPKLMAMVPRFDRIAVMAYSPWVRNAAKMQEGLAPEAEVKVFNLKHDTPAEAWLMKEAA